MIDLTLLSPHNVVIFMLLFTRFASFFTFMPFYDSRLIPISVKAVLSFLLTILFFNIAALPFESGAGVMLLNNANLSFIFIGLLAEVLLGFFSAFFLQTIFSSVSFAGEVIGFSMGVSVSSTYDPLSASSNPIISILLNLLCMLTFISLDLHHQVLLFIARSLELIPVGLFDPTGNIPLFAYEAFKNIFILGFSIALPIVGVILLSDVLFGMIARAHPQFNLLVIGLPLKFLLALIVLSKILPSSVYHFERGINKAIETIGLFLT